ncbi:MAG TPA: sugar ABC transporter permease [Microbacterium sp.]|uniref:carbohydrate ABC transporter permease n=1 Tax=Microbacterium sp. TaxID=51671 RepID=UPI002CC114AE|nr:sugar ABC transporter permease [Microbacterium sp.]HWI30208.1 sugar ABC transporter permease [Microbacterium sp.]
MAITRTVVTGKRLKGVGGMAVDPRPATPSPRSNRPSAHLQWWWALPAVILVGLFIYGAFVAGGFFAFTDWRGIGEFDFVGFDNFVRLFQDPDALGGLIHTLIIAAAFLILTNVLGMALALALHRTLKTRHFLRALVFLPVVLSPIAVSYVWSFIFAQNGPLNGFLQLIGLESWTHTWLGDPDWALTAVIVVLVWQHVGLTMVIYLAALATIPPELDEAASVDGAGAWRRFAHISLPLLRPAIVVASTLMLVRGLSVFDQVFALTGGGPYGATETLATLVYKETFANGQYGYGAAIALILTVLILIFAVVQIVLVRPREDD